MNPRICLNYVGGILTVTNDTTHMENGALARFSIGLISVMPTARGSCLQQRCIYDILANSRNL